MWSKAFIVMPNHVHTGFNPRLPRTRKSATAYRLERINMTMAHASAKILARRAVDALPDNASLDDVIERLIVLQKIQAGLDDAARGDEMMLQEQVEEYFRTRRDNRT